MALLRRCRVISTTFVFALLPGCVVSSSQAPGSAGAGGTSGVHPVGPVAHDATEAWPDVPSNVPVVSGPDIASACVQLIGCDAELGSSTNPMMAIDFCVSELEWSAERAIPVSNLWSWNERAEWVVSCELAHAGDCTAQKQCFSGRDPRINCQEDGCTATTAFTVTCDGTVAHMQADSGSFDRDCSHAYATCDETSPTGCSDRHFSACPAGSDTADHCDGDVRLGCDGAGQVSYHDCSRMGGTCGASGGGQDCVYTPTPDPECASDDVPGAHCQSGMLAVCSNGKLVTVSAPGFC